MDFIHYGVTRYVMDFVKLAHELEESGLCIWPGFLSSESLEEIRTDISRIQNEQGFHRAATGKGSDKEIHDDVRRDDVHWLERGTAVPAQERLWTMVDSLKAVLNETLYLGLKEFEGHYAVYSAGGFYKRHRDSFQKDDSRTVSLVLYLNHHWQPANGGQLRVYRRESHTDIEPRGGTLVCFLSHDIEHEVLPSQATRLSFTGWFKR